MRILGPTISFGLIVTAMPARYFISGGSGRAGSAQGATTAEAIFQVPRYKGSAAGAREADAPAMSKATTNRPRPQIEIDWLNGSGRRSTSAIISGGSSRGAAVHVRGVSDRRGSYQSVRRGVRSAAVPPG